MSVNGFNAQEQRQPLLGRASQASAPAPSTAAVTDETVVGVDDGPWCGTLEAGGARATEKLRVSARNRSWGWGGARAVAVACVAALGAVMTARVAMESVGMLRGAVSAARDAPLGDPQTALNSTTDGNATAPGDGDGQAEISRRRAKAAQIAARAAGQSPQPEGEGAEATTMTATTTAATTRPAAAAHVETKATATTAGAVALEAARATDAQGGWTETRACKILYYYHLPKTGGGSIVQYFGHTPGVQMLRYESTVYVPEQNKTLYFWEHQTSAAHWNQYIVPQALKPGLKIIAHHSGRYGMFQMRERLVELRARAAAQGCDFLAATTLREPVERDISDEVFRRMIGVSRIKTYLGNEQLRFLLVNSQQTSQQCPAVFDNKPVVRAQALAAAKRMLREDFDLVATIEDLEVQKSAFLEFFGYPIEEVEEQRQQQPTAKQTPAAVEAVAAAAATTTTAASPPTRPTATEATATATGGAVIAAPTRAQRRRRLQRQPRRRRLGQRRRRPRPNLAATVTAAAATATQSSALRKKSKRPLPQRRARRRRVRRARRPRRPRKIQTHPKGPFLRT
uniref:Uncharacterized protein n=1 Tax=Mantoniella antarctica TaxID=81844 RepID=A0A7S0SMB4_9CHLO